MRRTWLLICREPHRAFALRARKHRSTMSASTKSRLRRSASPSAWRYAGSIAVSVALSEHHDPRQVGPDQGDRDRGGAS